MSNYMLENFYLTFIGWKWKKYKKFKFDLKNIELKEEEVEF